MGAILLYWLYSFPLACLMSGKFCCVRRPHFPLGNLSEVGAQHVTSVSHDSVKPILFCFFCQVDWGSHYFMGKKEKKVGLTFIWAWVVLAFWLAYHYNCSHGLQPWVWCLTTPQAYSISTTTCTLLHHIRVYLVRLSILWVPTGQGNIKQQYFCTDCIHFLPSVVRTIRSPTSERLPSWNWGRLTHAREQELTHKLPRAEHKLIWTVRSPHLFWPGRYVTFTQPPFSCTKPFSCHQ